MFSIIPTDIRVIIRLLPPYEKNGSVTPVTGTRPTTTAKFKRVWKESWNIIPNVQNFAQLSGALIDIFILTNKMVNISSVNLYKNVFDIDI